MLSVSSPNIMNTMQSVDETKLFLICAVRENTSMALEASYSGRAWLEFAESWKFGPKQI